MAQALQVQFLASALRSANGSTNGFRQAMHFMELNAFLSITAVAGTTPTLDVVVETFDQISGSYFLVAAFPQKTGVSTDILKITGNLGRAIRIRWTIGGTASPSFTFSVGGVFKTP